MIRLLSFLTVAVMVCAFSLFAQPDPNDTAVLDDFEDIWGDKPNQTNLGAVKGVLEHGEGMAHEGGGWWYAYFDSLGSAVLNGTQSDTIVEANIDAMFEEDSNNRFIHVWLRTDESTLQYPYAGIGCNLTGEDTSDIYDLSSVTAIKLKVKGEGFVALRIETMDVLRNFDWGIYQTDIDLTGDWEEVTIPVSELEPPPASEPYERNWRWEGGADADNTGREEAVKLSFQVKNGDYAELYVDDITLEGMIFDDFVPIIVTDNKPSLSTKSLHVSGNIITYILLDPQQVFLGVYDLKGKLVNELVNKRNSAGTFKVKWNGENNSVLKIANGTYIIRLNAGLQCWNEQLTIVR